MISKLRDIVEGLIFIFNQVRGMIKRGGVFYFEFVRLYKARTHFRNVRILFHDRTVLSQQANNISSSFSKCSLCQKVLRFTRTAHKGGFTSIKKLKRRLLEPCPSSSIPSILCKGRGIYIFFPFSLFLLFSSLSLSLDLYMPCFAYPVANPCKSLIYRIPSLPPYTAYPHFPPISFPRRLHLHLRPFLPLLFRACSLPPRCSSFFLSHFSTPFPVSSREYKKG